MNNGLPKIPQILSCLTALALGALVTNGAEAQSLRGTLLHEITGAPVSGAYIVLLSSDSTEVTRALTNPLGQFRIDAPRAGTYRVRTERIGYRSVVSSLFELTESEVGRVELTVEPVVLRLDMLTIEGADECRVIGDQAIQVLAVWEEARKALTAVAWKPPAVVHLRAG